MADIEREETEQKQAKAPKLKVPRMPKPAGGGGSAGIATIVGWALALAALVAVFLLFKQVSALKHTILAAEGPTPRGTQEEGAAAAEAVNVDDWQAEAQQVVYELGKFTANTADGRHAQMEIALCVESYYRQQEWEAYSAQMTQYEELMKAYLDQQSGKSEKDEKKGKTEDAGRQESSTGQAPLVIEAGYVRIEPAQHGKKAEEPKALEPPVEPARPLTRIEREIMKQEAKVRDTIIEQINQKSAAELTSAEGRAAFKAAIIDALNTALPRHVGTVLDIYFRDLVTT